MAQFGAGPWGLWHWGWGGRGDPVLYLRCVFPGQVVRPSSSPGLIYASPLIWGKDFVMTYGIVGICFPFTGGEAKKEAKGKCM